MDPDPTALRRTVGPHPPRVTLVVVPTKGWARYLQEINVTGRPNPSSFKEKGADPEADHVIARRAMDER